MQPRPRPRTRPASFVLIASLALIGCAAGSSPAVSGPGPSPAGTIATLAPTAVPSGSLTAAAWRPVPEQGAVSGTTFDSVIWTSSRFVAAGTLPDGGAVILDSPDGLTWHRQALAAPGGTRLSLAAGPSGVVVAGGSDTNHATSWFSPDGISWQMSADAFGRPVGTDSLTVTDVVATEDGWLAVGREDPACNHNCGLDPLRARVWTSTNGRDWRSVDGEAALARGAISSITAGGPGFVAVGTVGTRAAVWLSADGLTWNAAPDNAVLHARPGTDPALWTAMTSVAVSHGILVAVGTDGNGGAHGPAARAWRSEDGIAWTDATGERFEGFTSGQDATVSGIDSGFLAAFPVADPTCSSGLWASSDGAVWACASADPAIGGFVPAGVAESPGLQLAVGITTTDAGLDGPPGAIWVRARP